MGPQTPDLMDHEACDSLFGSQGWSEAYPVTNLRKDQTEYGVVGEIQGLEAPLILQTLWNLAGKLPRRFFFSFQHINPWRLQIEATDDFVKVHELSLLAGLEREISSRLASTSHRLQWNCLEKSRRLKLMENQKNLHSVLESTF